MQNKTNTSTVAQQFVAKWGSEATMKMNHNHCLVLQRLRQSISLAYPHQQPRPSIIKPPSSSPKSLTFRTPSALDSEKNAPMPIQLRKRIVSSAARISLKTPQNKIRKIEKCNQSCKRFEVTAQRNKHRQSKEVSKKQIELQQQAVKSKIAIQIKSKADSRLQLREYKGEIRGRYEQSPTRQQILSIFKDMLAMKQGYLETPLRIATNKLANALQAQGL